MATQNNLALFTDLYELTMAASYYQHRMFAPATFSLFVRKLPPDRGFLVAAGLAEVVHFLETFALSADDLAFLQQTGRFQPNFLEYVAHLRFIRSQVPNMQPTWDKPYSSAAIACVGYASIAEIYSR